MSAEQFAICQLQYDKWGDVVEWGPSNATKLIDERYMDCWDQCLWKTRVIVVPCWTLLWVEAEIRDFPPSRNVTHFGDHGWEPHTHYFAADWADVAAIFVKYFACGGCYSRLSWRVERVHWTESEGWENDDLL